LRMSNEGHSSGVIRTVAVPDDRGVDCGESL
jgi:hypothetical protein